MKSRQNLSIWTLVMFLAASVAVFGQTNGEPEPSLAENAAPAPSVAGQDRPVLQERNPRYQVMPGDSIAVSFPLSPELNDVVTIQPDGYIDLDNVSSIYIQGQTVPQIVETIKKAYAGILNNPIVDVDLTNFQKAHFTIGGQVAKPGQYDLRYDTTVTEGVAIAGGLLSTGKSQVFLYHRVSSQWVEVKKLNLKDIMRGKNVNEDVHLQPGDMVFVPETFVSHFRKYIPYSTGVYLNPSQALF